MEIYAEYDPCGTGHIRKDTLIYLNGKPSHTGDGSCIGEVLMCNPGTPKPPIPPGITIPWSLRNGAVIARLPDSTLRNLVAILANAVAIKAGYTGPYRTYRGIPELPTCSLDSDKPFVRVLNLFYWADSDPVPAWASWLVWCKPSSFTKSF